MPFSSNKRQLACLPIGAGRRSGDEAHTSVLERCALGLMATAVSIPLTFGAGIAHAALTAGDPIKSAQAILRNALPVDNKPIRGIQRSLESISESLRIPGNKSLGPINRAVRSAQSTLTNDRSKILADIAPTKKADGNAALAGLERTLTEFMALIDAGDKQAVPLKQREALTYVGQLEEDMVKAFPFEVPKEYADKPLLLGRATVQMVVHVNETPDGKPEDVVMDIVLDGYNAPVSAGNFADLVLRGFYNGMDIQRADGFVVQTGKPDGSEEGFVDPVTGTVRRVPIEIKVIGDKEPVYDLSLEDLGRYNEQPVLPFNAYGTLAVARSEFENNSGSSQVFFLLKESELTPSGANLLDGRYAVFGYTVEGADYLGYMHVGDKIVSAKLVKGGDKLVNGYKQRSAPTLTDDAVEAAATAAAISAEQVDI